MCVLTGDRALTLGLSAARVGAPLHQTTTVRDHRRDENNAAKWDRQLAADGPTRKYGRAKQGSEPDRSS